MTTLLDRPDAPSPGAAAGRVASAGGRGEPPGPRHRRAAPTPARDRLLAARRRVCGSLPWVVAVLAGQALVLADVTTPVLRPVVAGALLVGLPVTLLARRWRPHCGSGPAALLYAVGATVLALIVVPLAINTTLPWLGVDRPLARPVLVVASAVVDLALVLWCRPAWLPSRGAPTRLWRRAWDARVDPGVALAAAAVVLAVAGAVRLDNGLGGGVAVAAHAAAVLALGVTALRPDRRGRDAWVVYLSGLALLLGTSLRGFFITGHDIQNEYLAFLYTHTADHWVQSAYPTPYNACLSVTILPATLVEYTGLTGVVVFTVLLQVLFALVPVVVYVAARRLVSGRVAVLAAAAFVASPTFYTDMPYLTRQEVAYVFLALAMLAATQPGWTPRRRRAVAYVGAVGVILSHYATTYLLVIMLVAGFSGLTAGRVWRRLRARRRDRRRATDRPVRRPRPPRRSGGAVLLHPLLVVLVATTAWTWSSPLTHSGGHLAETVKSLANALLSGSSETSSSDLKYAVIFGDGPTAQQRLDHYVLGVRDQRAEEFRRLGEQRAAATYVFPAPSKALALPRIAERPDLPLTSAGQAVQDAGVPVAGVNALSRLGSAALLQLALAIGLLALLLRARRTRRITREGFWLALGAVAALASCVVVPGLSASYGVLRAFQQTLIVVAPLLALGLVTMLSPLRRFAHRAATATIVLIGLVLTGALPALTGGYQAVLTQSNSGAYYEQLYTQPTQVATARWLGAELRGQGLQRVTAGDIVAITRLQMWLPRAVAADSDLLPLQLRRGTYLVLGPQTVVRGTAGVFYTGDVLTYRYPIEAVEQRMNLVYSSPGNRVYR